ncbi:MAG: TonB-dependent receptor [Fulvivirga sp.]|nr:TonB-dependent receptor [Fulvivirga sp.]
MNFKKITFLFLLISGACLTSQVVGQDAYIIGRETSAKGPFTVSGKVTDSFTGEAIIGANIFIENTQQGTASDVNGEYAIKLAKGNYLIKVSSIGYESKLYSVRVNNDGKLNFRLKESTVELGEVVISGEKADRNVQSTDIGKNVITLETIKTLPAFVGEVDVLKTITLLPGVQTVGEASSGFNVRGGAQDQNLILLGGAPLYNPSHLFGFFSAFNSNLVRSADVYKGGIPAQYGGRGSSIIDIKMRTGNMNYGSGNATIGLISSKVDYEGPIINNKMSILAGGRISYVNWLLNSVNNIELKRSKADFYDGTVILNYIVNDKNQLKYTFYQSYDEFKFQADTTFSWQNRAHVLAWNHIFNDRLASELSLIRSEYKYDIQNVSILDQFVLESGIDDTGLKLDFNYDQSENSIFSAGIQTKLYQINPGDLSPLEDSNVNPISLQKEKGIESAVYLSHDYTVSDKLSISYGIRFNRYMYLGDFTVNEYQPLRPLSESTIINQQEFDDNEVIVTHNNAAPRASLKYSFGKNSSIKIGYNKMFQYIHLISNTAAIAPTDVWRLTSPHLKPQEVTQYSMGVFKNLKNNTIETSVEVFYKEMDNVVEYKDGAELLLNDNIETELIQGQGRAYGAEFYLKKKSGRLNGWMSYTYSRSKRKVAGLFEEEQINKGEWYPANFDKPHDFTFVFNYKIKKRLTFGSVFNYSTGRPTTFPKAKYELFGTDLPYFTLRNQERIPNYHRLDLSLTFSFRSKSKLLNGDWTLSVYNVYGRKNAFSVFFNDVQGLPPQAFKLAVVGSPIPSLSYSFKF